MAPLQQLASIQDDEEDAQEPSAGPQSPPVAPAQPVAPAVASNSGAQPSKAIQAAPQPTGRAYDAPPLTGAQMTAGEPMPSTTPVGAGPQNAQEIPSKAVQAGQPSQPVNLNPWSHVFARAERIHNPLVRTLAEIGARAGAGISNLDPNRQKQEEEQLRANEQPSAIAKTQADTTKAGADTEEAQARTKAIQAPIDWKSSGDPLVINGQLSQPQVNERTGETRMLPFQAGAQGPPNPGAAGGGAPAPAPTITKPGEKPPEGETPLEQGDLADTNSQLQAQYAQAFPDQPVPPYFQLQPGYTQKQRSETASNLDKLVATKDQNEQRKIMNQQREATEQQTAATRADTRSRQADEDTNKEIDKAQAQIQPILTKSDAKIETLAEAMTTLDKPNGEKDAMAPVKALVAIASGQGSGVRITMPELQRIAQARGWTDSAKVTLNNIFEPESYESMSPSQRTQLKGIIQDVYGAVEGKNDAAHQAYGEITGARSVPEVRTAQEKFNNVIKSQNAGGVSGGQRVQQNSKGEYRYTTDGGKTWQPGQPPQK